MAEFFGKQDEMSKVYPLDETTTLSHGAVVIAAITSCTNTSNPSVMLAAGLVAKKAVEKGLVKKSWVKTSLAPGSKVVSEYLNKAGLTPFLDQLGFGLVGYGCTTCIGNSGPLPDDVTKVVAENDIMACSVLSGNRNFEGANSSFGEGELVGLATIGGGICDCGNNSPRHVCRATGC